jgi:MFS family permease
MLQPLREDAFARRRGYEVAPMALASCSPRTALILVFMGFGALGGCWAGAIPAVARAVSAGNIELGIGFSVSTAAGVALMGLGGRLARAFPSRPLIATALTLSALSMALLLLSGSPAAFLINITLAGASLGLLDVSMNAEAGAIERDLKRPVFTSFHGALSATMAVFAALSSAVSAGSGLHYTALAVLAAAAISIAAALIGLPARSPAPPAAMARSTSGHGLALTVLGLATGATIIVETSAILWSAKLLDEMAPALAAYAGLGVAFFASCTAAVRLTGDLLRSRFREFPLMLTSLAVAAAGCIMLGQSDSFALSVAAFATIGFGTAMLCPCIFAMAARMTPENSAGGIGRVSLVAGAPRIVAPWIFGWVAEASGIAAAFGLCASVLAVAFALLMVLRARRFRQESAA